MSKAEDSCAETMTYDEDLNLRLLKMFWVRLLMSVFFFQEKGSNHSWLRKSYNFQASYVIHKKDVTKGFIVDKAEIFSAVSK